MHVCVANYYQWILSQMDRAKQNVQKTLIPAMTLSNMAIFDEHDAVLQQWERAKAADTRRIMEGRLHWLETQKYAIEMIESQRTDHGLVLHIDHTSPTATELQSVHFAIRKFYLRALQDLSYNMFELNDEYSPMVDLDMFEDMLGLSEKSSVCLFRIYGNLLTHPDNQWSKDPKCRNLWNDEFSQLVRNPWIRIKMVRRRPEGVENLG